MLLQRSWEYTAMGGWLRIRRVDGNPGKGEELYRMVVAADRAEKTIVDGMKSSVIQAPSTNFATRHDDDGDACDECAQTIDERALYPMRTTLSPPMHHHAGLRKSEGQESTDGIERDERSVTPLEKNEEGPPQSTARTTMPYV